MSHSLFYIFRAEKTDLLTEDLQHVSIEVISNLFEDNLPGIN